ncbi:Chromobox protein [Dirofilaria immitis]
MEEKELKSQQMIVVQCCDGKYTEPRVEDSQKEIDINCYFQTQEIKHYYQTRNQQSKQKMRGDNGDSSSDEDNFNTEAMFEERYCNRKKMKEYLLKWKGYSSMNNVSKLEADLEYDALISDYNVHKKKKKWKNSKSQSGVSSSSYFGGRAYMVPCHGDRDNSPDAISPAKPSHHQISCKGAKYSASVKEGMGDNNLDASNETDDEYDSHWLRMLPSLGQSGIEKGWIPEMIMSTFMVAGLYKRRLNEESGTSNDDDKPVP